MGFVVVLYIFALLVIQDFFAVTIVFGAGAFLFLGLGLVFKGTELPVAQDRPVGMAQSSHDDSAGDFLGKIDNFEPNYDCMIDNINRDLADTDSL